MFNMNDMYERLAAGEHIPMPDGKRARPTGPAATCPKCQGSKRVVEEQSAAASFRYLDTFCGDCWEIGKIVPFVIEPDPMVLAPWAGAQYRHGKGVATRETRTGERVAMVRNDRGTISTSIVLRDDQVFRLSLAITAPGGEHEPYLWEAAIRLADAELSHLGYRET